MAKILVIDDEPNNRLLLVTLLTYAGHVPLEAADGNEGLRIVREQRPDLVVVDLALPGMHGSVFLKTLRADAEIARTEVALYTGTPMDSGAMRDFLELMQVAHVIPKPGEPAEILRIVGEALRHAGVGH